MKPKDSKGKLSQLIKKSRFDLSKLTPVQGFSCMLDFYKNIRVEGCTLEQDGDMILFQWGTFPFDGTSSFQLDITRQFILSDPNADQSMSQLSLKFYFSASKQVDDLKKGNKWCNLPSKLNEFKAFIESNEAYSLLKSISPIKTSLNYNIT